MKKHLPFYLLFAFFILPCCQNTTIENNSTHKIKVDSSTITTALTDAVIPIPKIAPPIKGLDIPKKTFKINPKKEKQIKIETGTVINIPKDAFVDAQGQPVTSEVDIQYREFHDAADIIASGIPMMIRNDDGSVDILQTAGMFQIQGSANGQPIKIAKGKAIEVNLASFVEDKKYNHYLFDEKTGNWVTIEKAPAPIENVDRKKELKALKTKETKLLAELKKPKKIAKSTKRGSKNIIFDPTKSSVDFNINGIIFPDHEHLQNIKWQFISGDKTSINPLDNEWILEESWDLIDLQPTNYTNVFELLFANSDKQFRIQVTPSMKIEDFQKEMEDYQKNIAPEKRRFLSFSPEQSDSIAEWRRIQSGGISDKELQKAIEEQKKVLAKAQWEWDNGGKQRWEAEQKIIRARLEKVAKIQRSFQMESFGLANCDIRFREQGWRPLLAKFEFKGQSTINLKTANIFLVTGQSRVVITFNNFNSRLSDFGVFLGTNSALIIVGENKKIAVFNNKDFKRNETKMRTAKEFTFSMDVLPKTFKTTKDLRRIIKAATS